MGVNCVKDANGKVQVEIDEMKEEWRKDTEKLLNEEWHKTKTASDWNKYKEARRNARSVALAQEKTRQEVVNELVLMIKKYS